MLEAGNAITIGFLVDQVASMAGRSSGGLLQRPFIVLAIMFLAWLNYRGVLATLTFNLVITSIAFTAVVLLFVGTALLPDLAAEGTCRVDVGGCPAALWLDRHRRRRCTSACGTTSASRE